MTHIISSALIGHAVTLDTAMTSRSLASKILGTQLTDKEYKIVFDAYVRSGSLDAARVALANFRAGNDAATSTTTRPIEKPIIIAPVAEDPQFTYSSLRVSVRNGLREPISGAFVRVFNGGFSWTKSTDFNGNAFFQVPRGITFTIMATWMGQVKTDRTELFNGSIQNFTFFSMPVTTTPTIPKTEEPIPEAPTEIPVETFPTTSGPTPLDPLTPDEKATFVEEAEVIRIIISATNSQTKGRLSGALVELTDLIDGNFRVTNITDTFGKARFDVKESVPFRIRVTKDGFLAAEGQTMFDGGRLFTASLAPLSMQADPGKRGEDIEVTKGTAEAGLGLLILLGLAVMGE